MKYIKIGIAVFCILAMISNSILYTKNKSLDNKLSIAMANQKASDLENSALKDNNRAYQYTISQLTSYKDSVVQKMDSIRKGLNIKDKNLTSLQYISSRASKRDTLVFTDTIFKNQYLTIDTILGDGWYKVQLGLRYPNIINIEPSFISKKYIITSKKKETINPPKKFFLFRWFQKKHWVIEVIVKEENPYIQNINNKFIEIVN